MTGRFVAAAIGAAIALALGATPAQAKLWRTVTPVPERPPITLSSEGVVVTLAAPTQAELDAVEEGRGPATTITVQFPGQTAYVVPTDEYRLDAHGVSVGIGRLNKADAAPVVIFEGYSGGMHCCATFQMVALVDGAARTVALPGMDGAPAHRFPHDINRDGTADIVRADDRFLYAFTSYNASWAPPLVFNLRGGQLIDVSAEPGFAKMFADYAKRTGKVCASAEPGGNGACAAYAAAMARQGKAAEGIAFAVAQAEDSDWLPEPCTVELDEDGACPEGKARSFTGFAEALRWFLTELGYTS